MRNTRIFTKPVGSLVSNSRLNPITFIGEIAGSYDFRQISRKQMKGAVRISRLTNGCVQIGAS